MNPDELRMAGAALERFFGNFGQNVLNQAATIGAETLGTNIGKRIGNLVPPGARQDDSSIAAKRQFDIQMAQMEHERKLERLDMQRQMQQERYLQGLDQISARSSRPDAQSPGKGTFNVSDIYKSAASTRYF